MDMLHVLPYPSNLLMRKASASAWERAALPVMPLPPPLSFSKGEAQAQQHCGATCASQLILVGLRGKMGPSSVGPHEVYMKAC